MFEATIENVMKKNESDHQVLLQNIRSLEICDVIDSLTETEFLNLQASVVEVFHQMDDLLATVKEGFQKEESYLNIHQMVISKFREEAECSGYYKNFFFSLLSFLESKKEDWLEMEHWSSPWSEKKKQFYQTLETQFYQEVLEPLYRFRNQLQESLCSRNLVKNRILQAETQAEIKPIKDFYHLAQRVKEILIEEDVSFLELEKIESLSVTDLYQNLILPIIHWNDPSILSAKEKFFEYSYQKRQKQQDLIDSKVSFLTGKLEEFEQLEQEYSACLTEENHRQRKKQFQSIRNRLVSLIRVSEQDTSFNRFNKKLRLRSWILLHLGWTSHQLKFVKDLLDQIVFSLTIECSHAKKMLFNTEEEDVTFITEFLETESRLDDYLLSKKDFDFIKRRIEDPTVVDKYKAIAHDRKLFFSFLANALSLTKEKQQELIRELESGKFDEVVSLIREEILETVSSTGQELELPKIWLYEQVMEAREVQEGEIIKAMIKSMF